MRVAWCSNCRTSVDETHAISSRPCPICSSTNYIVVEVEDNSDDAIQTYYTSLAEGLMEAGQWAAAEDALRNAHLETADFNLRMYQLLDRRDCAEFIARQDFDEMPVDDFRKMIVENYDEYEADWFMKHYRGIRLVANGNAFHVTKSGL